MATLGHVAVGLAAGRLQGGRTRARTALGVAVFGGLALLPDVDVLWVSLGVPDGGMAGHRGFTHSLVFAVATAVVVALGARRMIGLSAAAAATVGLFALLAVGSHGVLDAMTHGSRGIPFLWPLSVARFTLPWRPIPVAPTGLGFATMRGAEIATIELLYFLPLVAWALWPRAGVSLPPSFTLAVRRAAVLILVVGACLGFAELALRDTRVVSRLENPPRLHRAAQMPRR